MDEGFKPYYVVNPDKKKKVTELKKFSRVRTNLRQLMRTALSRGTPAGLEAEGSRAPHGFHEITKEAIRAPWRMRSETSWSAQETRILDRLYGYEVSPLCARSARPLLAGRVQSVATPSWLLRNATAWRT